MFNFSHTFISKRLNLVGQFFVRFLNECISELHHNFSMWFFNNQIWNNKWKIFIHLRYTAIPLILKFPFWVMFFSGLIIQQSTESIMNPNYNFKISICDLHSWPVTPGSIVHPSLYKHSSFAVNYAGEISELSIRPHEKSLILNGFIVRLYHIRDLPATVNDLSGQIYSCEYKAKVLSASKVAEVNPKRFVRQIENIWSIKSKRNVICSNKSTGNLTKSRPFEINFRKLGVYKFSLIILKTLPGYAGGNKGQAGNTVQVERSKRENVARRCGTLNSAVMQRGGLRRSTRLKRLTSNRMVLNETAELLGLSLRRVYAQLKSSLMDSKFLPDDAEDNEAELAVRWTVNAVSEKNTQCVYAAL
jgi:hypothetical protein